MNTLGIMGGIGRESTIEYYRTILAEYRERHGDANSPSIVINSIDVRKLLSLVATNKLEMLRAYLVEELQRLATAGASLGILAANTPHIVFDEVQNRSPIPLVSIVDATCAEARARDLRRLGLMGRGST
jgi:aspartate racemase